MQDDDLMLLQDPQFLMVLVAAITKKYGGSITISVNGCVELHRHFFIEQLNPLNDLLNPAKSIVNLLRH